MTLAEFYAARLDEDEAAARAATPGEWAALDGGVMSVENESWPVSSTESARNREDRVHIARHDPARVLREVEAKRKILETIDHAERESDAVDNIQIDGYLADDLRKLLALPFSDHPDYDQEWRP